LAQLPERRSKADNGMASPASLYDITVWLEVGEGRREAVDHLVAALGESPTAARARGVQETDSGVSIEFPDVAAAPPVPQPEQPHSDAALQELADMEDVLPAVRALIAVSAARVQAGLTASERVVIDVKPARLHSQEELRHS
jgi:hypothetical protein